MQNRGKHHRDHPSPLDKYGRRQPRPPRRRQGTRSAVIRSAVQEG